MITLSFRYFSVLTFSFVYFFFPSITLSVGNLSPISLYFYFKKSVIHLYVFIFHIFAWNKLSDAPRNIIFPLFVYLKNGIVSYANIYFSTWKSIDTSAIWSTQLWIRNINSQVLHFNFGDLDYLYKLWSQILISFSKE